MCSNSGEMTLQTSGLKGHYEIGLQASEVPQAIGPHILIGLAAWYNDWTEKLQCRTHLQLEIFREKLEARHRLRSRRFSGTTKNWSSGHYSSLALLGWRSCHDDKVGRIIPRLRVSARRGIRMPCIKAALGYYFPKPKDIVKEVLNIVVVRWS